MPALVHADRRFPSEFAASPVHGAFREAVVGPAFMPGLRGTQRPFRSPVHGASRWLALAVDAPRRMAKAEGIGKPRERGCTTASCFATLPAVNGGPKTAAREAP